MRWLGRWGARWFGRWLGGGAAPAPADAIPLPAAIAWVDVGEEAIWFVDEED